MLTILCGDALTKLRELADESVQCCVTSPPYWGLRDYGTESWEGGENGCKHEGDQRYYTENTAAACSADAFSKPGQSNIDRLKEGRWRNNGTCVKCGAVKRDSQLGLEKTPEEYVAKMVEVFREVRRVLRKDGTLWLNLGDSYASGKGTCYNPGGNTSSFNVHLKAQNVHPLDRGNKSTLAAQGLKPKDLIGIPWRVAFALQADGWWLRSDIIWNKANCMPESVTDRPTRSHEYLFLMTKSARYYYDSEAIKEPASESDWESRIGRANLNNKLLPTDEINGIRPRVKYTINSKQRKDSAGGSFFKNAEDYNGKNGATPIHKNSKQRGHSRRNDGFNESWDAMEKAKMSHGQDQRRGDEGSFSNNKSDRPLNGMRNKRDVWTIAPANFPEAHFATYPPDLIKPCIMAGTRAGDTVLDPFAGSGTTGMVSLELGRQAILIELNPKYVELIEQRCDVTPGLPL